MIYLLSFLFGLIFGSFANVCILRLPVDKSIIHPRSTCPRCKTTILARHNIPIFSFLALGGRCAHCRAPISLQYPIIEALMALVFLFHAWMFAEDVARLILADLFGFILLTLSIIDYRHRIIPDELSLSLIVIGVIVAWVNPILSGPPFRRLIESIASTLGGGLLMLTLAWVGEKAFKKEALGGGDVKLIAGTGAMLGWQGIYGPLLVGSLSGGLAAIALLFLGKKRLGETLPFGPFLSLGAYVTILFPKVWPALFRLGS